MSRLKYLIIIFSCIIFIIAGCRQSNNKKTAPTKQSPKELILYCENSMLNLVLDLKTQFETQFNCSIRIQNDCSQNLMNLIRFTGKGDIYIPASTASFDHFSLKTGHNLIDSTLIGYNQLVFMVKKNNPKIFDGRFSSLLDKDKYALIIANPETSSIGYETRRLLNNNSIYNKLLPNIVAFTSDSKGLIKSLKNNQADVIIDWQSNIYVNTNNNYVKIINPIQKNITNIPIYAASLSCSSEPTLTSSFLKFTNTHLNETRLSKYGFTRRETIIF